MNSCARSPGKPPLHLPDYRVADYDCLNVKLKTYYARKRKLYEDTYPDFYDADLRQLFAAAAGPGRIKASAYLRRRRRRLLNSVCQWTNEKKFRVNKLLARLIDRCDQLGLACAERRPAAGFSRHRLHHHAGDELSFHRQIQTHQVTVKKKLKVLALFDAIGPTTIDQDLSAELKTEDWKTEANVLAALRALGYTTEHLAIFDDLDLLRQKLATFAPDALFNLADQFKNNRGFDQNIVSFLEMQGVPFTGCGATGLMLCKHKGISKKILELPSHSHAELRRHPARPADCATPRSLSSHSW